MMIAFQVEHSQMAEADGKGGKPRGSHRTTKQFRKIAKQWEESHPD